jgi:hypothetical protein
MAQEKEDAMLYVVVREEKEECATARILVAETAAGEKPETRDPSSPPISM